MKHSILMAVNNWTDKEQSGVTSALHACEFAASQNIQAELVLIVNGRDAESIFELVRSQFSSEFLNIHQSIIGQLTASLNIGINHCLGEYISRFDADDICKIDRLVKLEKLLDEKPDIVAGAACYNDGKSNTLVLPKPLSHVLMLRTPFIHPAVTIRKEFLVQLRGYQGFEYAQDYDLALRSYDAGAKYLILSEPVIEYSVGVSQALKKNKSLSMQIACGLQRLLNKFSLKLTAAIIFKIFRLLMSKFSG